ncbi:S1-like domain-containing RNA-binding protein [Geotalea sp. SG265]|uniref:CvfB family protein n=1 Tax=Geotalea sp. SG265 TaxID=2922867 RepID=UPI001FB042EE|nr:S1-like domain-containing RNA-binding protein [Geotalea sp. SG265]
MLEIGTYHELEVKKLTPQGAYLLSEEGEILLPRKYVPSALKPGDRLRVFIYLDSEDRLVATTKKARAQVGEFALLNVKETGAVGAFLDWGLDKDLLVPFAEQPVPMKKGEKRLVRVYLDRSGRISASARIERFLNNERIQLKQGDEVDLILYQFTDLGAKVVINGMHSGLLFKSELYGRPGLGSRLKGYVKKVRDDGKIDVTLKKSPAHGHDLSRERILKTLATTGGFLPLTDRSSPDLIADVLKMSKRTFKKAIGGLYKEGYIDLKEEGIQMRSDRDKTHQD